jgi:alpha-methylacyl-CoA racemase
LSQAAGHDINYIAITGALHAVGLPDKPVPPLNYAGDFGGGALYLVMGMLAALLHARATGEGQVVDAAMTDGAASLSAMFYGLKAAGAWRDERKSNLIDGGAPFYDTYICKDGRWMAVGAIEPQFFATLLDKLGIADFARERQLDRAAWPALRARIAAAFLGRTQAEWVAALEGSDACAAGVIGFEDAPNHPHNRARETFVTIDGVLQPAPAPRFSKTPGRIQETDPAIGAHNVDGLLDWGLSREEIGALESCEAL